jgi:Transposase DDE domain group 1
VQASHSLARVSWSFDEPNLVPAAGLVAPAELCQRMGLAALVAGTLRVPGPCGANGPAKVASVLGGMLAGADSIEDMDVLRAGATPVLFDDTRAPSTLGSWLRSFTHGNVRQLDAVSRELRVRLWAAGAGPHRRDRRLFVDGDSTILRAYGAAKQGVSFGYTKVRGYHPLLATVTEPGGAPDVLHTRLREGRANTARGAASFLSEAFARARAAGSTGELVARLDGGFYNGAVVAACRRAGVRFSITTRNDAAIRRAIAGIEDSAWVPIPYWNAEIDPDTGEVLASHAEVAETTHTAFAGRHRVTARLVVRRVRRLRPLTGQLELDTDIWRYHGVFTDRIDPLLTVEAEHRDHAIVEQVIADLKAGPLAHCPSGSFTANAAWLALAALAHNLARALGILAGHEFTVATTATIRDKLIKIPGRLVRTARRYHLRLVRQWPRQTQHGWARRRISAIPQRT